MHNRNDKLLNILHIQNIQKQNVFARLKQLTEKSELCYGFTSINSTCSFWILIQRHDLALIEVTLVENSQRLDEVIDTLGVYCSLPNFVQPVAAIYCHIPHYIMLLIVLCMSLMEHFRGFLSFSEQFS